MIFYAVTVSVLTLSCSFRLLLTAYRGLLIVLSLTYFSKNT